MTALRFADLDPAARELAAASTGWMDAAWDDAAALLRYPGAEHYVGPGEPERPHMVRETAWYALGLLLRDGPGDRERATRALRAVLAHQYDAPDRVYHGTFARAPEEPPPPPEPREWRDYDPNWREFIGTTLALILDEYAGALPADLVAGIDEALRRAVAGTLARRVRAEYTNIALMSAYLLCYTGDRFGLADWLERGETLAREVHHLFRQHDTFEEYNSPTYYGVDLYALALWRSRAPGRALPELGADMEARLWNDIARYYHADLRNIAGPYDRSYGMDLRRYAAILGMWIWAAVGAALKPFPDPDRPFAHASDFCFGPCIAVLGARIPAEALPHFTAFRGERQVEQVISSAPRRVATAWLGRDLMLGGEATGGAGRVWYQFVPATIHWRAGDDVGWLRLEHTQPVDARVARTVLTIAAAGTGPEPATFTFAIAAPGLTTAAIAPDRWRLPGLTVEVETNAAGPDVALAGDLLTVRYTAGPAPVTFALRAAATPTGGAPV